MSALIREAYEALQGTPATVTRGWPQAIVPLPSISLSQLEDSLKEGGERQELIELCLRCSSPEAADALAGSVETALAPLGLRRTACRDGSEKDRGNFLKLLRYERRTPAGTALQLAMGGKDYQAELLYKLRERRLMPQGGLSGALSPLVPGPLMRSAWRVKLPACALQAADSAFREGIALSVEGSQALIASYSLKASLLELELWETGGEVQP